MYQLKTEADFDSAHFLSGYTGKCSNIHGHRWHVEIEIESRKLEKNGQGEDAGRLRRSEKGSSELADSMDHTLIYEENTLRPKTLEALDEEGFHLVKVPFRPTAENFSEYFFRKMEEKGYPVKRAVVYETPNNCAAYRKRKKKRRRYGYEYLSGCREICQHQRRGQTGRRACRFYPV